MVENIQIASEALSRLANSGMKLINLRGFGPGPGLKRPDLGLNN